MTSLDYRDVILLDYDPRYDAFALSDLYDRHVVQTRRSDMLESVKEKIVLTDMSVRHVVQTRRLV